VQITSRRRVPRYNLCPLGDRRREEAAPQGQHAPPEELFIL
jgi:hypothetical protein